VNTQRLADAVTTTAAIAVEERLAVRLACIGAIRERVAV
jgi:hypothetical protein